MARDLGRYVPSHRPLEPPRADTPSSPHSFLQPQPVPMHTRTVDEDEVADFRQRQIDTLRSVLQVSPTAAETALRAARWDVEAAVLKTLESDQEGVSTSAGSLGAGGSKHSPQACSSPIDTGCGSLRNTGHAWTRVDASTAVTCAVCFEPGEDEVFVTDCGSHLCFLCFRGYVRVMVQSGARAVICPMQSCATVVSGELVSVLLLRQTEERCPAGSTTRDDAEAAKDGSPHSVVESGGASPSRERKDVELLEMYRSFQVQDCVAGSLEFRHCPGQNCDGIVRRTSTGAVSALCGKCQTGFCFRCSLEDHWPLDCQNAKEWFLQSSENTKNMWWILCNTKACPRCKVAIEKNGGCSHMFCTNCNLDFSWTDMVERGARSGASAENKARNGSKSRNFEARKRMSAIGFKTQQDLLKDFEIFERVIGSVFEFPWATSAIVATIKDATRHLKNAYRELSWGYAAKYFYDRPQTDTAMLNMHLSDLESACKYLQTHLKSLDTIADEVINDDLDVRISAIASQSGRVAVLRRTVHKFLEDYV